MYDVNLLPDEGGLLLMLRLKNTVMLETLTLAGLHWWFVKTRGILEIGGKLQRRDELVLANLKCS